MWPPRAWLLRGMQRPLQPPLRVKAGAWAAGVCRLCLGGSAAAPGTPAPAGDGAAVAAVGTLASWRSPHGMEALLCLLAVDHVDGACGCLRAGAIPASGVVVDGVPSWTHAGARERGTPILTAIEAAMPDVAARKGATGTADMAVWVLPCATVVPAATTDCWNGINGDFRPAWATWSALRRQNPPRHHSSRGRQRLRGRDAESGRSQRLLLMTSAVVTAATASDGDCRDGERW